MDYYNTIEERRAYGPGFRRGRKLERRMMILLMIVFGFLWAIIVHFIG